MRITESSVRSCRSRSWSTMPVGLFPVIQCLLSSPVCVLMPLSDFCFDVGSSSCPSGAAAVVKVGIVGWSVRDTRDEHFLIAVRAALHYHPALGQVFENFRESFAAVERRGNSFGVEA